jgi:hypothetical protein
VAALLIVVLTFTHSPRAASAALACSSESHLTRSSTPPSQPRFGATSPVSSVRSGNPTARSLLCVLSVCG